MDKTKDIQELILKIEDILQAPFKFMEVCGTHTVAIFRTGLRSLFPEFLCHISGPGCPVCVTHPSEIALGLKIAEEKGIILTVFGDMMRVPDHRGISLKELRAKGAEVEICYSPLDALKICKQNPKKEIVFWGVGFETTAPTVAATIYQAKKEGIKNFSIFSCHKIIPPALKFLVDNQHVELHGFLLPGHVSTIIGVSPYQFLAEEYNIPAVISGFEALDILQSIYILIKMKVEDSPKIINQYIRGVKPQGNERAKAILDEVFCVSNALWRGIGEIENSGLKLSKKYKDFDRMVQLSKI